MVLRQPGAPVCGIAHDQLRYILHDPILAINGSPIARQTTARLLAGGARSSGTVVGHAAGRFLRCCLGDRRDWRRGPGRSGTAASAGPCLGGDEDREDGRARELHAGTDAHELALRSLAIRAGRASSLVLEPVTLADHFRRRAATNRQLRDRSPEDVPARRRQGLLVTGDRSHRPVCPAGMAMRETSVRSLGSALGNQHSTAGPTRRYRHRPGRRLRQADPPLTVRRADRQLGSGHVARHCRAA